MCGIVGKISRLGGSIQVSPDRAEEILDRIRHRGPDAMGQYTDEAVWFGHVRLSVLDLSEAGRQPMTIRHDSLVISYNGEVYNFAEVAAALDINDLRSHSDTEVILSAFAKLGVDSIPLFNGMFAFAIYDRVARKVWLVRDRLGIKPLYYRFDEDGFSFSSEIKGLLAASDRVSECDLAAMHEWLYYGNSLGERTLFQGVKKLLPGHFLELDLETFETTLVCYWSPTKCLEVAPITMPVRQRAQKARDLLEQAVKRQLVSDVPVGVFLSGGVDSSAITAFASRHYRGKLSTYSVGFDFDEGINELPTARKVAQLYGTDHHELHVSGFEIADTVVKMVDHHDTPFSDAANIPLYLLSSKVNGSTKVILQGDGGDELFGGYSRYTTLSFYRAARSIAWFGSVVNRFLPNGHGTHRRERYINALRAENPAEVLALLLTEEDRHEGLTRIFGSDVRQTIARSDPFARYRACYAQFATEDAVNQMLLVDAMIILPDIFLEKVDRATMAASIEVRVPFLDNDLVEFCMRLSGPQKVSLGRKKWLMKKALKGVVPDYVLYGKKTGFGVPYGSWLRDALKPLFFDELNSFQGRNPGVLDGAVIQEIYKDHVSRRRERSFLLWKILNLMIWANRKKIEFGCGIN